MSRSDEQRAQLVRQIETVLAMDGDLMTIHDMIDLARQGRMQIHSRDDAVVVTELMSFPRRKIVNGILAAGNLRSILDMESDVERFARSEGADAIITHGRPGWGRVGKKTGWQFHSMCFVKRLGKLNGGGR